MATIRPIKGESASDRKKYPKPLLFFDAAIAPATTESMNHQKKISKFTSFDQLSLNNDACIVRLRHSFIEITQPVSEIVSELPLVFR